MATSTSSILSINSRRKFALIIANANYTLSNSLSNTVSDAKAMSTLLKRIGFQIYGDKPQLDLTFDEMRCIVTDFTRQIKRNDMALFYFAGHGNQWQVKREQNLQNDFKISPSIGSNLPYSN